jgi:ribosome-associated heat shock protein Hsp15
LDRQRIDKWLWHARVVRTRSAAAGLVAAGHVRLNSERVTAASRLVRAGDVVTIALDRAVRILKVAGFAERRGDAEAARGLYASPRRRPPRPAERPRRRCASPARDVRPSAIGGRSGVCWARTTSAAAGCKASLAPAMAVG